MNVRSLQCVVLNKMNDILLMAPLLIAICVTSDEFECQIHHHHHPGEQLKHGSCENKRNIDCN